MTELTVQAKPFDLSPQTFEQALTFAGYLAESQMVPKDFMGKPGNCLVAIQWGMELGLKPLQCMQNIAVINGRPSLWGDAVMALVLASPVCKDVIETYEGTGDNYAAVCIAQRVGKTDKVARFSLADAKAAGLLGKSGPWTQYRDRMMKMRARAFALRDQFADVLKGMAVAEEAMDTPPERHMGDAVQVQPTAPVAPAYYPVDQFVVNLPKWQKAVETGRKTSEQIIAMAESKHPLTDEQKAKIQGIKPIEDAHAAGPAVTYASVSDQLYKATDMDTLDAHATLIGEVSNSDQRVDLVAIYESCKTKLSA